MATLPFSSLIYGLPCQVDIHLVDQSQDVVAFYNTLISLLNAWEVTIGEAGLRYGSGWIPMNPNPTFFIKWVKNPKSNRTFSFNT